MTFCLFWLFTPNIKIQLICACLICSCLLNTLSWRDLAFLLLLSASCSSSNPTGEMSTRSTFSTIPIWEFPLPNHSSEAAASTSPKGILIVKSSCPISAFPPSLSLIALILLSGPLPLPSHSCLLPLWLLLTIFIPHSLSMVLPRSSPSLLFSCSMLYPSF